MSSQIGNKLKVSVFGESHGRGIGAVIDGFPAGMKIDMDELLTFMKRRAPGRDKTATPRREEDLPQILSGVLDDVTCGTPIACVIANKDQHSADYKNVASVARPGHADYTGFVRYRGFNDVRGGGHFSARLTAPLVFAGGLSQAVSERERNLHRSASGSGRRSGGPAVRRSPSDGGAVVVSGKKEISGDTGRKRNGNAECHRRSAAKCGTPWAVWWNWASSVCLAGVGSPIFDTVEGRLAYGFYGIPAVKGVEFGAGLFRSPAERQRKQRRILYFRRWRRKDEDKPSRRRIRRNFLRQACHRQNGV